MFNIKFIYVLALLFIMFSININKGYSAGFDPVDIMDVPPCQDLTLPETARVPCTVMLRFNPNVSFDNREKIVKNSGAAIKYNYTFTNAATVVVFGKDNLEDLKQDPNIDQVILDRPIRANPKPENPGKGGKDKSSGQIVPFGILRIGATPGNLPWNGDGVGVAITDTGLDLLNQDLLVSSFCFTAFSSCQDGDGHGTHVGGIVAAKDNDIDVVGVASGATLYAVKVLDDQGNGSDSTVTAGLDWIITNANLVYPTIRVVNMSLGRSGSLNDNPILHSAIKTLHDLGISVIVSAGNDPNNEVTNRVPATYPEVMAIASITAENGENKKCKFFSGIIYADTASYFTTDGPFQNGMGVTISAPGEKQEDIKRSCTISSVGILSLKVGGGTTRKSGTSMAAPHTSGVAALLLEQAGGELDPEVIRNVLRNSADSAGGVPHDSLTSSYSFDGEREGVLSACQALGTPC